MTTFELDGKEVTVDQIMELYSNGKRPNWNIDFTNVQDMETKLKIMIQFPNEFNFIVNSCYGKIEKSYEKFLNPDNELHGATMVYDIALYETCLRVLQGFWGNADLPKLLRPWKPKFGIKFLAEGQDYLADKTNSYWLLTYLNLQESHDSAAKQSNAPYGIECKSVKDIEIAVDPLDSKISITNNGVVTSLDVKEVSELYNSNAKKPNIYFEMLVDLSRDLDVQLKADGKFNNAFAKGNEAEKHLSNLSKRLDSMILVDSDKKPKTKRWFTKLHRNVDTWKPRFKMVQNDIIKQYNRSVTTDGNFETEVNDYVYSDFDRVETEKQHKIANWMDDKAEQTKY